uniref:Uncharacterized protein n=1 Tax=Sphaerodactylus townsendi TaxID=933632 RepID=A0ACB8EFN3_9SAUR
MFHVVTVNFPDADRATLENAQRQLGRQIKEEDGGEGHSMADDGPMSDSKEAAAWKSAGPAEPGRAGDTGRLPEGEVVQPGINDDFLRKLLLTVNISSYSLQ